MWDRACSRGDSGTEHSNNGEERECLNVLFVYVCVCARLCDAHWWSCDNLLGDTKQKLLLDMTSSQVYYVL